MSHSIQFSKVYNNARLTTKELISIEGTFLGHPVLQYDNNIIQGV
jgi:hypothetical protein